jgi:hypothetical protein
MQQVASAFINRNDKDAKTSIYLIFKLFFCIIIHLKIKIYTMHIRGKNG